MLTMTLDHYQQSEGFSNVLDYLNAIFIVVFSSECLSKIFALRYHYFVEPWNLFDFVVVILSILGKFLAPPPRFSTPKLVVFPRRSCTQWFDWKIFCVTNIAESSKSCKSRPSPTSCQRCKRHSHTAVCVGHVLASTVQHLSTVVLSHVHFRHFWNVIFHACQRQERPWWCVQFQDVRSEYDPPFPGELSS